MTDLCNICEEALDSIPCTELLCHHKYHTQCFLANIVTGHQELHAIHCVVCEQGLFPEEEEQEDQAEEEGEDHAPPLQEETRLLQLYDNNEEFRNDLKKFVKAGQESSKPRKQFQNFLTQKKRELKDSIEPHIAQAQAQYDAKKMEILQSDVSKNYKQTTGKWTRLWSKIRDTYHVDSYSIGILRSKPGMRRLHAPGYYDRRSISRILRYSLGYGVLHRRMRL